MLTLFLTVYAGLIAIPLGILLALGRRSRLPLIRFASVVFIEFWRGVPIITVIFLASLLLPLIMPTGFDVDRLARAVIGLAFVIAAYMAEAVRGGLQAVPEGQAEAAQALGLGYWRIQRMIVLPQALRIALPAMTNEFIALFKNTTLVLIVSIFDLLGIAQAALADPAWVGMNMEAYVFAGAIYWFACFGLSQWSRPARTSPAGRPWPVGRVGQRNGLATYSPDSLRYNCPTSAALRTAFRPAITNSTIMVSAGTRPAVMVSEWSMPGTMRISAPG